MIRGLYVLLNVTMLLVSLLLTITLRLVFAACWILGVSTKGI